MIGGDFLQSWVQIAEVVNSLCHEFDSQWRKRRRIIDSAFLVAAIMKMSWSKNSEGYGSNLASFWRDSRATDLKLRKQTPISNSSFCEARMKLDEEIFRSLNQALLEKLSDEKMKSPIRGYRVFSVDGSIIDLPRPLVGYGYELRSEKSYYPQGLMSCLYNVANGIPYDFQLVSHKNERICAIEHLDRLSENDVIIYDRGYFSYVVLWHHNESKVNAVFRLKSEGNFKKIQQFIESGKAEEIITFEPDGIGMRNHIKKMNPEVEICPVRLRLIKGMVSGNPYYFATTIFDPSIDAKQIVESYKARWAIEELYKISKCLIGVEDFHSKTDRGVKQELYAAMLMITISRIAANETEQRIQKADPSPKKTRRRSESISKTV